MNRKVFLLTLCFTILLATMLFGSETTDALEPMPKLECVKIVPVQNLPKALDQQRQEDSLYYCLNLAPTNAVGFNGAMDWEGAMRLTSTELGAYAGWNIIAISWYHYATMSYSANVKVYDEGTTSTPGAVLTTEPYSTSTEEWVRVDLSTPVAISGSGDLWCSIEISQTAADFPLGVDGGPAVDGKGDWIYYSGGWNELQNLGLDYNWSILAIVEQGGTINHDVGVANVLSPPEGIITPADYDVIGQIHNWGDNPETFNATANVYDTTDSWNVIFTQTFPFTGFPASADSSLNFGTVNFPADKVFFTEIFTDLVDDNPANDTASIYSRTALGFCDVVFEMDVETPTGDNQCLGVEFDGTYFYVTSGGAATDPNKVYVLDTLGTLIWTMDQPSHSTGWGWRDIAWDNVYVGADRIDTLYASVNANVDKFGIDLTNGTLNYYGSYLGPANPNRALAWDGDSAWFFTANWDPCYKFSKTIPNIQNVSGPGSLYGSAYDNGDPVSDGPWVWWHGQTGATSCHIEQMEPVVMTLTGVNCDIYSTITSGMAGGLCFYSGFRGMDILFALIQGTPDAIVGIYVRTTVGVAEEPVNRAPFVFGLSQNAPNPIWGGYTAISYSTTTKGSVSLKNYNSAGRLVRTLINNSNLPAGTRTVYWDMKDNSHNAVAAGVYFYRLSAENRTTSKKMVVVK